MSEEKRISWKTMKKSPYLTSAAFEGKERIILTIARATQGMTEGLAENSPHNFIHFVENGFKPMLVNSTNAKVITFLAQSEYLEDWAGTVIELYAVDGIKAFGAIHDGVLRVSRKKVAKAKPILNENNTKWQYVIDKIASGETTWAVVENFYDITPSIKAEIEAIIKDKE